MGEDRNLVAKRPVLAGVTLVDCGKLGREFAGGNVTDAGHIVCSRQLQESPVRIIALTLRQRRRQVKLASRAASRASGCDLLEVPDTPPFDMTGNRLG